MSQTDEIWPSQDGVDRSESFAIIAIMSIKPDDPKAWELISPYNGIPSEVQRQLSSAVNTAIWEVAGRYPWQSIEADHYPVGPQAGGLIGIEHYIATIWEHANAVPDGLSMLADGWAMVEVARRVKAKLSGWVQTVNRPDERVQLDVQNIYPPKALESFCVEHVRRTYHPRAKLSSNWHVLTEEFWAGYRLPSHPTATLEYLVVVEAGRKVYSYRVTGTAEVSVHSVRESDHVTQLPIPELLPHPNVQLPRPENDK